MCLENLHYMLTVVVGAALIATHFNIVSILWFMMDPYGYNGTVFMVASAVSTLCMLETLH